MSRVYRFEFEKSTVSDIYDLKDKIDLSPEYQRQGELWTKYKKQLFLDSILNNFDIPKIYLHVLQKPYAKDDKIKEYAVIDGRQRLETLWEFIENKNELTLGDNEILYQNEELNLKGYSYQKLTEEYPGLRGAFDEYKLPIIALKTDDDDDEIIEDMFSRLNEAVAINAAEKRNAQKGEMIKLVRTVASHDFFTKNVSFKNKRMQHHEVAVRLLFLEECIKNNTILDTKKQYLDDFVERFEKELPNFPIYENVKNVLDVMAESFESQDPLLKKQGRVLIYYLLYREAIPQQKIENVRPDRIRWFNELVENNKEIAQIDEKKIEYVLIEYDRLTIQGTNDASSIKRRFHTISKYLEISSERIDNLNQDK